MSVWELTVAVAHGREEANRCGVTESPRELLESVWNDTASELSRLASAMGLPVERVQDVLQDVYLVGLQKCPRVVGRDELRRWLFRVTVNRCNLEHRRGHRWQAVLYLATAYENSPAGKQVKQRLHESSTFSSTGT